MVTEINSRIRRSIALSITACHCEQSATIKIQMFVKMAVLMTVLFISGPVVYAGFQPEQRVIVQTETDGPRSVYAADLDGDGDLDVLSASEDNDMIAWYENE